ncbi:MAG: ABC transporter ATP-binding protein [Candidatus Pacebacteria bacterium]|nr:ABC transporter ATP-binding protein [Candidatus Paceibacterota bacterium]MDR3582888.1 ABC transporter ATP-binding protein [Candidatus Paceibacterota bacterium]
MKEQKKLNDRGKTVTSHSPSLFGLLRKYMGIIVLLAALTVIANGLSIAVPKIIANAIDTYTKGSFLISHLVVEFSVIALLIFLFTYLQNIVQVYASEKVARDMRNNIAAKISVQPYAYIETATPAKILTNLTSDVDAVKTFVSTAVSSLVSSAFLIVGVSVLLLITDWKLGLAVLSITPVIGLTFFFVLKKVRKLFVKSQEAIDWLNKVISESILGSALIRLLNSQRHENEKFLAANTQAKDISFEILALFSSLIPVITFFTNLATLMIVLLGGHFVIQDNMSLGNFTAFNSYLAILIFPIIILGFISNLIAQAEASYGRIRLVLNAPVPKKIQGIKATLQGDIEVKSVSVNFGEKMALKDISFSVPAGSKTAIIGPTAAGKTQLLYLLTGLLAPTTGKIYFDGKDIDKYDKESLHSQVGFVFQDSVMFNMSLRENIAFSNTAKDRHIEKAIETAQLKDYVAALPQKLDTIVSERGTSLSGGQKQRIMLARALALDPKILLLDDFTARVDTATERNILGNIAQNYPDLTLISVTQKISSIEHYNQIILLMEGELLAKGTHEELLRTSPEYVQIFRSQQSTNQYELKDEK